MKSLPINMRTRHQIAKEHARRRSERLVQTDGWKVNGEPTTELYTSLDGFHKLGHVGVTWVEA